MDMKELDELEKVATVMLGMIHKILELIAEARIHAREPQRDHGETIERRHNPILALKASVVSLNSAHTRLAERARGIDW